MISVVGHTAIDHLFRVPDLPGRHNSTYITDHKVYFGGGAANIAAGIATLGEKCQLISSVGGDFPGSDYDRWLRDLGVEQDFAVVKGARTATAYVFTDDAGDQETFFEWGASAAFARAKAPALDFVHMATADPDFNVRVAEKSTFASFDPGQDLLCYTPDQLEIILANIDILFSNNHEMDRMCDMLGLERAALIASVPMVVTTRGAEGSMLYMEGEEYPVPAVRVDAVDPTGAGDGYRAGFLTAFRKGYAPLDCCRAGAVVSSFVVEQVGTQTNLPDWDRMLGRYRKVFGEPGQIIA
ncbi:carbohydrate kinase family protein [Methanoculleus bourgensis]|jgi:sugar/nucleoside kinase (ribokinase family)|uniref:Carbohydrate kinase family protein n=1 Tax=Methanoculleus bourgensis TaxID=83986 RepID=A0A7K4C2E0_9EURY|nr:MULTISPECIES: carbohydrate kinase family protein [Methanoculleus]MBT0733730.1 carbohydrate kinase family protein [Methanoculleus bourgensis]MDD3372934.1 carbohydrate kinase family protein [Methanoculleus bourgensis]NMA88185.1 carbohydrate kinase family protein [Methanoculleus bourgensis]NQS77175.1 carbohydrate kinase family protein [Methanoculleus bourgensis]SAI88035.1 ribokinase [Methanoculleus bourgensis]